MKFIAFVSLLNFLLVVMVIAMIAHDPRMDQPKEQEHAAEDCTRQRT